MPRPLDIALPTPPDVLRQGPLREGTFTSKLHDPQMAVRIGRWLGLSFAVCFTTGLISHYHQNSAAWLPLPAHPAWGYRVSQGIHVATGLAAIPLLLAKLWTVYPRFWEWPPVRTVGHALERLSITFLIAGAIFQLITGTINIVGWYPWHFSFTGTHYQVAWITIGALLLHIAVKLPLIREHWRDARDPTDGSSLSRRGFLVATGAAVATVTVATVGQTLRPLDKVSVLGVRSPDAGPQGVPVNRTAAEAQIMKAAQDPAYDLQVAGPRPFTLSLAELEAMPRVESSLPITCVEGWSAGAHWRGVRLRDLLDRAGVPHDARVRLVSLEKGGTYATSVIDPPQARDGLTLIALELNGARIDLDHGFPARLIAPNRPGVLQTKWVSKIEVVA